MGELLMPSLGADMDAGTVIEWLVKPGDLVHRGDIVAVVDTDKADVDIETFEAGTIDELLVPIGVKVPVGTPLARFAGAAAARPPAAPAPAPTPVSAPSPRPATPAAPPRPAPGAASPLSPGAAHSPLIRRLARHLGVDLATLTGSGPGGSITRDDVERAAAVRPAPITPDGSPIMPADDHALAMRRAIAKLMSRSAREIPQYHLATPIDLSTALAWLERTNLERPVAERLLPVALLLKATALAARRVPDLNGFWVDDEFCPASAVHLGVAVALRTGGLVAPAIHDADAKDLSTLMRELRDLVGRTRSGRLRSSEMADPTLTVTSLGDNGVDVVHGLIYPPQVALVGFGTIAERPWASGGMVGARRVVTATLAADHRASDGIRGARLLDHIDRLLQEPGAL
jgi:pyruvate dehydrogenase E2 component (dihydrolipoyllysine-residue acetyltransferase)